MYSGRKSLKELNFIRREKVNDDDYVMLRKNKEKQLNALVKKRLSSTTNKKDLKQECLNLLASFSNPILSTAMSPICSSSSSPTPTMTISQNLPPPLKLLSLPPTPPLTLEPKIIMRNLITKFFAEVDIAKKHKVLQYIRKIISSSNEDDNNLSYISESMDEILLYDGSTNDHVADNDVKKQLLCESHLFIHALIQGLNYNPIAPIEFEMLSEALWILSSLCEQKWHVDILLKFGNNLLPLTLKHIFTSTNETCSHHAIVVINNILTSPLSDQQIWKISYNILYYLHTNNYFDRLVDRCKSYKEMDTIESIVFMIEALFAKWYNGNNNDNNKLKKKKRETKIEKEKEKTGSEKEKNIDNISNEIFLTALNPFFIYIFSNDNDHKNKSISQIILRLFKNLTFRHEYSSKLIQNGLLKYIIKYLFHRNVSILSEAINIIKNFISGTDDHSNAVIEESGLRILNQLIEKYQKKKIGAQIPEISRLTIHVDLENFLVKALCNAPYLLHQAEAVFSTPNLVKNMIYLMSSESQSKLDTKNKVSHFLDFIITHRQEKFDSYLIEQNVLMVILDMLKSNETLDNDVYLNLFKILSRLMKRFTTTNDKKIFKIDSYNEFVENQGWQIIDFCTRNLENQEIDIALDALFEVRSQLEKRNDEELYEHDNANTDDLNINVKPFNFYIPSIYYSH